MRTTTALFLLLTAAVGALAAPTPLPHGRFNITSFFDSGSPHSIYADISFSVTDTQAFVRLNAVPCFFSQAIQPSVAQAPLGSNCTDTSVSFGLEVIPNIGYLLTVVHKYVRKGSIETVDTGSQFLGNDVVTVVDPYNPNGNFQQLNHSTAFEMKYNRA